MKRPETAGYAAILILALIWSYNWVEIKVATYGATPFALTAVRTLFSTIALFGLLAIARRSLRSPAVVPTMILGVLNTTAFFIFQTLAVALGSAGKAAILFYTYPFLIALLAWPLLGDRITGKTAAGLAFTLAGIAFIVVPAQGKPLSEAFSLLTALTWAAAAVYTKRLRARHDIDLLSLAAWQSLYGSVPLLIVAVLVPGQRVHWTPSFIFALAYIAVPATALATVLWLFSLSRLRVGAAGIASLLTPLLAVALSWAALGERAPLSEIAGIACIAAALLVEALPGYSSSRTTESMRR